MNSGRLVATLLLSALLGPTGASRWPDNPILKRLIADGVSVGPEQTAAVPPPTLDDGLDRDTQRSIVTRVAGRHGWNRFVRDSVVAPFALDIRSVKDADGTRLGHSVDLWFVAHGTLDTLSDETLVKHFLQTEAETNAQGGKAEELDAAQLTGHGFDLRTDEYQEKFVYAEFPLMERVRVAGVGHCIYSRTDESMLVAWELDERFAGHAQLRGRWQPIRADHLGQKQLGPARPYRGYGGYGRITALAVPEGALFVECHFVFHEPEDWFTGSNLLRAKMPLSIQESVRTFRRRLAKLEDARQR